MDTKAITRRPGRRIESEGIETGSVQEYRLGRNRRLFQITTFCPIKAGPGPTNLYLIEDDGLMLVDTGVPTAVAKTLFYDWLGVKIPQDILQLDDTYSEKELLGAFELLGYNIKDLDLILLTHGHVDHFLLGNKLVELSGAKVVAHAVDTAQICNPFSMFEFWMKKSPGMRAAGAPIPEWAERLPFYTSREYIDLSLKVDYAILKDGNFDIGGFSKDTIQIRRFPGHCAGAIGIFVYNDERDKAFMLCGDTILYPITPQPDDLLEYLRTLQGMKTLEGVVLTLPGHGKTIENLPERVATLQSHHQRRLQLTYEACEKPMSIWQIAATENFFDVYVHPKKFNPLAAQEALIHVELLEMVGGLHRSHIDGGVHYFSNCRESFHDVYQRIIDIVNDPNRTALSRSLRL